jgi:hypothetical protein
MEWEQTEGFKSLIFSSVTFLQLQAEQIWGGGIGAAITQPTGS